MDKRSERGFTLIELVIAAFVIMLLLAVTVILLRPLDFSNVQANARRQTDLAKMGQAIRKYEAANGELPGLSTKVLAISSGSGHYNLCTYLVPKYLKDLPMDPVLSIKTDADNNVTNAACNKSGVTYASGYGIARDKKGRLVLTSPLANGQPLKLVLPRAQ